MNWQLGEPINKYKTDNYLLVITQLRRRPEKTGEDQAEHLALMGSSTQFAACTILIKKH